MAIAQLSRDQKHQQRAAKILHAAQALARENGFLTLNVADVARLAGVSVGTLYVHFQSKEGLIAALAVRALDGRFETFTNISHRENLLPAEKLVTIIFADFLFSVDHPELFAAEQLASSTAVLKTVPGGLFQWLPPNKIADNPVVKVARGVIEADEFTPWPNTEEQAAAIDRGVWTLMAGSSHIWNVTVTARSQTEVDANIPTWLKHNACALLVGYGWKAEQPSQHIQRLADYALQAGRHLSPECCESRNLKDAV
jgi:AcrR family transcriptional regulator